MSGSCRLYLALIAGLLLATCAWAEELQNGVGVPADWSHRHLAVNRSAAMGAPVFSRDPRVLSSLASRAAASMARTNPSAERRGAGDKAKKRIPKTDWSVSLRGGSLAPTMSPAKFGFLTGAPLTVSNCTTDYVVYGLNVPGISGATVATISSITRATNTVTVTTAAAHGFLAGERVTINGVTDPSFNGNFVIATAPTAMTFTYSQTAANASSSGGIADINQANLVALNNLYSGTAPAGNNGLCGSGTAPIAATGAVRSGNVVTITTRVAHTFVLGNTVTITGVTDDSFDGTFVITSVPSTTTFTYAQTAPDASSGAGTAAIAASTYFAYAVSSATCGGGVCPTDGVFTSPSISFDSTGAKVAFVESVADAAAVCPGRGGTGACSIFHVLKWTANEGSIGAPLVPGQGGSTASLVSITYASATNRTSSPWIDYANDAAYVAADDGNLYRITGVFNGTPTLDSAFTMSVTGAAVKLSPPVQLTGTIPGPPVTAFNIVLIGDGDGNLWAVDALRRTVLGTTAVPGTPAPVVVGGHKVGSLIPGVLDAPLVYYDAVNDPSHISVLATASSSANTVHATITNTAAVVQGLVELNPAAPFGTFDDVAGVSLGLGATGAQKINLHAGAFDNTFFSTPTSGHLYACGTPSAASTPSLYQIGFNNPLASPRNLVPVLDSAAVASTSIVSAGYSQAECSPLTEFANPNLAVSDILFFGIVIDSGGSGTGKAFNWNISGALQASPIVAGGATESGGTSAVIVDNSQLFSGTGTSQGSSIYFTTLSTNTQCGASTFCAVKLRQGDFQ